MQNSQAVVFPYDAIAFFWSWKRSKGLLQGIAIKDNPMACKPTYFLHRRSSNDKILFSMFCIWANFYNVF